MIVGNGKLIEVSKKDIRKGTFDNWQGITSIGKDAFNSLENLKNITIPSSIEIIEESAFSDCIDLKTVIIEDGVKSIGEHAFFNCTSLEYIRLPSNLKKIEIGTFMSCVKLNNVIIPSGVRSIGAEVFKECKELDKIFLNKNITEIADNTFENCHNLMYIELPNSVKRIGKNAFYNCRNLQEIELSNNITEIGQYAFYNCQFLKKIVIPSLVKEIQRHTFSDCYSLKNVILSDDLEKIGDSAFAYCKGLTEVTIPTKVTTIGQNAFFNCSHLLSIKFPNNLTKIENDAFSRCTNLVDIVLPSSLKLLGDMAFSSCRNLKSMTISSKIESLGRDVILFCPELKEVIINNQKIDLKAYENMILDNVTYYGTAGFYKKRSTIIKILLNSNKQKIVNPKISYPDNFLNLLNNKELESILQYDSIKHFKEFYRTYEAQIKNADIDDIDALYKFAYFFGCFSNEEAIIAGKKVNVAQKTCGYLKTLLDKGVLKIGMCSNYFRKLKIQKYDPEFIKFITNSLSNFEYLLTKSDSLVKIINDFQKILHEQVITDSKGRVLKQTSVKNKIENYLVMNSYKGIAQGNEDIAKEFVKFSSLTQETFDNAQSIREKSKDVPSHILGKELKETIIMERIEELQKKINQNSEEAKKEMMELYKKEFTYEWLDKHDPKNFILGLYCDCCASIITPFYGWQIAEGSILSEDLQNLVIRNQKGRIIAKATIYVNRERGYAVFNDIEMNKQYGDESKEKDNSNNRERVKIYKAFKRGVNDFVEEYNKSNEKHIVQVNIGWGFNKLKQVIKKLEEKSYDDLEVPPYFKDATGEQWIVYKRK